METETRRREPQPGGTEETHIHDLPDECLVDILTRSHVTYCLPSMMHANVKVEHPLHCTLVCKRWHAAADAAVRTLHLHPPTHHFTHHCFTSITDVLVQKVVARFAGLTALSLSVELGEDALLLLATNTPRLQQLILGTRSSIPAVTQALAKWTSLTLLKLNRPLCQVSLFGSGDDSDEDIAVMFHAISKLPSLLHLRFRYYGNYFSTICNHVAAMSSLSTLDIQCPQFPQTSPKTGQWCKALRELHLCDFEGTHLPSAVGLFVNLQVFDLQRAHGLTTLPESIGCMSHLASLRLWFCSQLASLPSSLWMLTGLKELEIWGCGQLEALPESLKSLASLMSCTLHGVHCLRALPKGITEWRSLTTLTVMYADSLEELPTGLGQMCALKHLELRHCCSLKSLPRSIAKLSGLTVLIVLQFRALMELPETIEGLSGLSVLIVV